MLLMMIVLCVCRVPFLVVGALLISGERTDTIDSAFFYGRAQVRASLSALFCVFYLGSR